jgi:hypothetical protein
MKSELLKIIAGSVALIGFGLSAAAGPTPSGTSPTVDTTYSPPNAPPDGLNSSSGPTYSFPSGIFGVPVTVGEELFASGGPVYVTQLGPTGASYDEQLFLVSPTTDGDNNLFLDNHSTPNGTTYDLGTFAAGTEIEFGLDVLSTGNIWYDGPASRNADGAVHAYVVSDYQGIANVTYVGFEDEPYDPTGASTPYDPTGFNGDFNYTDEIYAFTGTTAAPPPVPDVSSALSLLTLGLSGMAAFGRRLRR